MQTTWIVTERSETAQRDDVPKVEVTLVRTFWYVIDGEGDDMTYEPVEAGEGNVQSARDLGEPDGSLVIEVEDIDEWPVGRHVVMDLTPRDA